MMVFGEVRQPAGSSLPGIAPSNAYACRDGYVLIAGNGDSIFRRLMQAIGRPELIDDPRFVDNRTRGVNVEELDEIIAEWTRRDRKSVV
jgi:formyl-CoA transferase